MVLFCFLIVESVFPLLLLLCFVFLYLRGRYQANPRHHTLQRGLLYLFHLDIKLLTFVNCLFYYICSRLRRASILSFLRLLRATFCTFQFVVSLAGNFLLNVIRGFSLCYIFPLVNGNSLLLAPCFRLSPFYFPLRLLLWISGLMFFEAPLNKSWVYKRGLYIRELII